MTRLLPFFVSAIIASSPATAQNDIQAWTGFAASGPVAGELAFYGEAQLRFADDISRIGQSTLRIGLGWQPGRGVSFHAGYARQTSYREGGPDTHENRLWQQASYPLGSIGRLDIDGRTRFEQRMIEGADETGWRIRQRIKGAIPIRRESDVKLIGSFELMLNLNGTDWGADGGFDQLRSFAGLSFPLAKGLTVEGGYLNRYQREVAGPDRGDHVASLSFAYRFGE